MGTSQEKIGVRQPKSNVIVCKLFLLPLKKHYVSLNSSTKHHTSCTQFCNLLSFAFLQLKFIYSKKATKFCEIFTLLLSYVVPVKSKVEILQNFVAFLEYMNFNIGYTKLGSFLRQSD